MPLVFKAKERVEFECMDCRTGSDGQWRMQFHNVLMGVGCPICKVLDPIKVRFQKQFPNYRLVPIVAKTGKPDVSTIRYQVLPRQWRLPEDFGWTPTPLTHASVREFLAKRRLPGNEGLQTYEQFLKVLQVYRRSFPEGVLRYAGKSKSGSTSPGPFYAVETGSRSLRAALKFDAIAAEGLLKHCKQEGKDRKLKRLLEKEAKQHGAKILGYGHRPSGGFEIQYVSRTGFQGCDTQWRAREKFWGQSGFRRGETLALVVLAELFPSSDWRRNTRPDFLLKANGHRLELDGYSPSHKLALEYQGNHHYKPRTLSQDDQAKHERVLTHDKLKAALCKTAGVSLVVIPDAPLDPVKFLENVVSELTRLGIRGYKSRPSIDAIRRRWRTICKNPLAPFQQQVVQRLGNHKLLTPEPSSLGKASIIRYQCGHCGQKNEAIAHGFTSGAPRRYCPQCKGRASGMKRLAATLHRWEKLGIPRAFLDQLQPKTNAAKTQFVYQCPKGHETRVHDVEHARRHIREGRFECPACMSEEVGVDVRHVASFEQYRARMRACLEILRLTPATSFSYDAKGELRVEVRCPHGHRFSVSRREVGLMARNECLNDLNIVPSACPACCYPGVKQNESGLLRGTVFHRLFVLRGMYPDAQYVHGFDPTSIGEEEYTCGQRHADGTPHPVIRVSFRNLQKHAKRYPRTHLCASCGLEHGQVVGGGKTLEELIALMKVMRDEIGRRVTLPKRMKIPTVEVISGEKIDDTGRVSTTKTRLRFWCGITDHPAITATKDYYFNRAGTRGYGFCPGCVRLVGANKAPLPSGSMLLGALRVCKLRSGAGS
ncbi:hypothetical protein [Dyella choica]|uniref:Uncharacterized protein n=1 Tax=Dyella choica TaxID=1927959 RepID=A0A432MAV7_9GAMM|nr:hypothetical protein [Dyella choica]RUL78760.1 hypothetical protein EKH80_02805 [Dyella choica]